MPILARNGFAGVRFTRDILCAVSAGFTGRTHYRFFKAAIQSEELFETMAAAARGFLYFPGDSALYTAYSQECEKMFAQHCDYPAQDFTAFSRLLKSRAEPPTGTRADSYDLFCRALQSLSRVADAGAQAVNQVCADARTQRIHIFLPLATAERYAKILADVAQAAARLAEGEEAALEKNSETEAVLCQRLKNDCPGFEPAGSACFLAELTAYALKNATAVFKIEYDLAYRYSLLRQ